MMWGEARRGRWMLSLVAVAAGLAACQGIGAAHTPTAEPLAAPALPAPAGVEAQVLPWTWDDRSPFRAGLVESEVGIIDQLAGASIYHLDLEIAEDALHVTGREEIRYTNQEADPLSEIVFRLFPNLWGGTLAVDQLRVDGMPAAGLQDNTGSILRVPLSQPLLPGRSVVVDMVFELAVPSGSSGNYGLLGLDEGVLALPYAYPLIPAYDERGWSTDLAPEHGDVLYSDASFYLMRVRAPAEWTLVASGVMLERSEQDGWQVATYAAGPMRDVYLTAGAEYDHARRDAGDVSIHSYAAPDGAEARDRILEIADAALDYFEDLLGPYPYTEFDVVETHTSALGMEYPGIVALSGRLYDAQDSTVPRDWLEAVVVHEAAHQWAFGLVGNDQVREPWLDESLAQYLTLRYYGEVYGDAGRAGFRRSLEARWESIDDGAMWVGRPVGDYSPAEYSAIVYGKGGLFFDALEQHIGTETMDALLRDYVTANRFGVADGAAFQQLAESRCACSLDRLFEEWIGPQE